MKHSRETFNKPIQELIHIMQDDYPTNFELVITSSGAEIRSTMHDMVFTDDSYMAKLDNTECFDAFAKWQEEHKSVLDDLQKSLKEVYPYGVPACCCDISTLGKGAE